MIAFLGCRGWAQCDKDLWPPLRLESSQPKFDPMRLGLLADIHEAVEPLRAAVDELNARKVDSFVMLGDVLDHGERVDETVALLRKLHGAGVWGNHDFGLCGQVDESARSRFSTAVLEYFATLRPRLIIEGIRFQHIDPHLDPEQFVDLWQFPTAAERLAGLARCPERRAFAGHLHRWEVYTPKSQISWDGDGAFQYQPDDRYLTIIGAVADGWCAVFDSEKDVLEPISLRGQM